jgi:hypothetical protein
LIGLFILVLPDSHVSSRLLLGHGAVVTQRLVINTKIHANFVVGITVDANKVLGIWFYFHIYFSIGCRVFWKWSFGIGIYELNCIFALFHHCCKEIDKNGIVPTVFLQRWNIKSTLKS